MDIQVREIQKRDIKPLSNYWFTRTEEQFLAMGADSKKFPTKQQFKSMIEEQIASPVEKKKGYALIWEYNGKQIGHTNVNQLTFGKQAHMHLHIWDRPFRKKGLGTQLVKLSVPIFFENLKLKTLWCEPYAKNPAPNKTLPKLGFQFVKNYMTTPGPINFHQEVNQFKMSKAQYKNFYLY